jgi:hypothetical protein
VAAFNSSDLLSRLGTLLRSIWAATCELSPHPVGLPPDRADISSLPLTEWTEVVGSERLKVLSANQHGNGGLDHVSGSAMKVRKASASAVVRFATMPLPVMVVCRKLDGELSSPRAWRSVTI